MCYKLHDFPPNFKPTMTLGPKRSVVHVELDSSVIAGISPVPIGCAGNFESESPFAVWDLTEDQYS